MGDNIVSHFLLWHNESLIIQDFNMARTVIYDDGSEITYDDNVKITHWKQANGFEIWCDYDANGNLLHHKTSDGFETWYEYDAHGNKIHWWNAIGHVWNEYDDNGNLIHTYNSAGNEAWFDPFGNEITKEEFDQLPQLRGTYYKKNLL